MPRTRIYQTNADRQRAYRNRKQAKAALKQGDRETWATHVLKEQSCRLDNKNSFTIHPFQDLTEEFKKMFYGGIRLIFRVFEVCTTEYLKKQPLKCLTALLKVAWQTTERMLLLFYRPGKGEDFIQLPPSFLNYLSANRDGLPTPIL